MQSGYYLEDLDKVLDKITKIAETNEGSVATADNLAEVNIAFAKQAK